MKNKTNGEITPKILTEEWLKLMDMGGCNPKNPSKPRKVISFIYILSNTLLCLLMALNFIFGKIDNLSHFAERLIIILGYFQQILKLITALSKAKQLSKLMDIIWTQFWSVENSSQAVKIQVKKIYKILRIVAHGYGYNIIGATFFFIIGSVLSGDRTLPMDIWIPNKQVLKQTPYYQIVSFLEIFFTISSSILILIPFDALFIIMIGLVYCQFIILNEKLLQVGNEENEEIDYETVRKCIAHHNLMLTFLEIVENVYSGAYFLTIGSNLFVSTMSMYGIVMESETSRVITFCGVLAGDFLQLYFYCQAGQLIQDKVESIGEAAYNCNWYTVSDENIKMSLRLIILRSQKRFNIIMGGFMVLNLQTFATVVRASFSFLTFLENIKS